MITRWGTWLIAAVYYCDHLHEVKSVVDSFDSEDAQSIANAQPLFADAQIRAELVYIKAHFSSIPFVIKKLETQGLCLIDSLKLVDTVKRSLQGLSRPEFHNKMTAVIHRNKGFKKLVEIGAMLEKGAKPTDDYVKKLSPHEVSLFKYCPVTSSDVERVFSRYGNVLTKNRERFLFENLKQHMIVHCNAHMSGDNDDDDIDD